MGCAGLPQRAPSGEVVAQAAAAVDIVASSVTTWSLFFPPEELFGPWCRAILERNPQSVRVLQVVVRSLSDADSRISEVLERCSALEELWLGCQSHYTSMPALCDLPMKSVGTLKKLAYEYELLDDPSALAEFQNLEELRLVGLGPIDLTPDCHIRKLRHLRVPSPKSIPFESLETFLHTAGRGPLSLEFISLDPEENVDSLALKLIADNCPNLEQLKLRKDTPTHIPEILSLFRALPKLSELALTSQSACEPAFSSSEGIVVPDLEAKLQLDTAVASRGTPFKLKFLWPDEKLTLV